MPEELKSLRSLFTQVDDFCTIFLKDYAQFDVEKHTFPYPQLLQLNLIVSLTFRSRLSRTA
jgi:hypothetical protein